MEAMSSRFLRLIIATALFSVYVSRAQHASYHNVVKPDPRAVNNHHGYQDQTEYAARKNAIDKYPLEISDLPTTETLEEITTTTAAAMKYAHSDTTPITTPLDIENMSRAERKARRKAERKKSRRRRRSCKCLHRYKADVDKLIQAKLDQFKEEFLTPRHNNIDNDRVGDQLLSLSSSVAEAQKDILSLSASLANLRDDFPSLKKDVTRVTRHVHRLDTNVANLGKMVDNLERRVKSSSHRTGRLHARHSMDITPGQIADQQTTNENRPKPKQCHEVYKSGSMDILGDYYIMIKPKGVPHAFKAHCRMANDSGWTVIQKRQDGSVDFYRDWADYTVGFGNLEGEFWLGLDNIHYITTQEVTMLRIEMEDWDGNQRYADYDYFRVDGPATNYKLHIAGYHGNAGDSMTSMWENHNGMPFSTRDKDNDGRFYDSCAKTYRGGWWFNNCFESHLNGKYYTKGFHQNYFQRNGIQWNTMHMYSSLKKVMMMIKPAEKPNIRPPPPPTGNSTKY